MAGFVKRNEAEASSSTAKKRSTSQRRGLVGTSPSLVASKYTMILIIRLVKRAPDFGKPCIIPVLTKNPEVESCKKEHLEHSVLGG